MARLASSQRRRPGPIALAANTAVSLVLGAALLAACGDEEARIPAMSELECEGSDGTNSTSFGDGTAAGATTPEEALRAFAVEEFLNLDETRGSLRIVRRSANTARAEYVVDEAIRAVLVLSRTSDWRMHSVAWCSSVEG